MSCQTPYDGKGKGYLYAVITAITCPCHLPLTAVFLGSSAAGVMFAQHFMLLAIFMGIVSLISFIAGPYPALTGDAQVCGRFQRLYCRPTEKRSANQDPRTPGRRLKQKNRKLNGEAK